MNALKSKAAQAAGHRQVSKNKCGGCTSMHGDKAVAGAEREERERERERDTCS